MTKTHTHVCVENHIIFICIKTSCRIRTNTFSETSLLRFIVWGRRLIYMYIIWALKRTLCLFNLGKLSLFSIVPFDSTLRHYYPMYNVWPLETPYAFKDPNLLIIYFYNTKVHFSIRAFSPPTLISYVEYTVIFLWNDFHIVCSSVLLYDCTLSK